MAQIFVDLAAGTAVTVGGEGTIAGLGSPAKRLLADLFTKFYESAVAAARADDSRLRTG